MLSTMFISLESNSYSGEIKRLKLHLHKNNIFVYLLFQNKRTINVTLVIA